ncbi:MAG: DUF488 domain-containing protein [Nitrospira sp.]|nr:DUF488 domain-containing protein [Nitrospira sp.]
MMIKVKRVYDQAEKEDGDRFLVDRLWPRGIKKEALHPCVWLKNIAPSDKLRQWFGHQPERWDEFRRRYFDELNRIPDAIQPIFEALSNGDITLLYSAKDTIHNNAIALKEYLNKKGHI